MMRGVAPHAAARNVVLAFLLLAAAGCASEEDESPAQGQSPGDFKLTTVAVSATQVDLSWEDPSAQYLLTPLDLYSEILRDGTSLGTTHAFVFTDSGAAPGTRYCYRVEAIATYQEPIFGGIYTYGWLSNEACVVTPT